MSVSPFFPEVAWRRPLSTPSDANSRGKVEVLFVHCLGSYLRQAAPQARTDAPQNQVLPEETDLAVARRKVEEELALMKDTFLKMRE